MVWLAHRRRFSLGWYRKNSWNLRKNFAPSKTWIWVASWCGREFQWCLQRWPWRICEGNSWSDTKRWSTPGWRGLEAKGLTNPAPSYSGIYSKSGSGSSQCAMPLCVMVKWKNSFKRYLVNTTFFLTSLCLNGSPFLTGPPYTIRPHQNSQAVCYFSKGNTPPGGTLV